MTVYDTRSTENKYTFSNILFTIDFDTSLLGGMDSLF